MHIEKLKSIQECLASAAEAQVYDLENVDAQELGEVIDIIKDIEETIYYCTVTKAMKEGSEKEDMMYYTTTPYGDDKHPTDWDRMYYTEKGGHPNSTTHTERTMNNPSSTGKQGHVSYYYERELPDAFQDEREGKSYRSRRMYMEAKESKQDKTAQMRELEKYAQELTQDIVDMIQDASTEERQFLSKKIALLANKITQTNG